MPTKLTSASFDELAELISDLDVAAFDPLRPMVPGDFTNPKDASAFLSTLRRLQNETGTTLVLTHHIRKPDRKVKVHPEDLQYEIKGATEYVDAANTVLLLERASQPRDPANRFASATNHKALHFVKVKDAPADPKPMVLQFNETSLLFQPVVDLEEMGGFSSDG